MHIVIFRMKEKRMEIECITYNLVKEKWSPKKRSVNPKRGNKGENTSRSRLKAHCRIVDLNPTISVIMLNVNRLSS